MVLAGDVRLQVLRFCHQYLQAETQLDYPPPSSLRRHDVQEYLFQHLFSDGALQYPPPQRYQRKTIKELLSRIEDAIDDWEEYGVSDDLMASLSQLMSMELPPETTAAQMKSYVTYYLSDLEAEFSPTPQVTLLESRSLIAASGTTGLRTWEAALYLGVYLSQNQSLISGKRVLELGAGTGYLSILCARYLGAAHCIASDGSDDVVNSLPDNFFLNEMQGSDKITASDIKWGHALVGTEESEWNGGRPIDVILGADITFDKRLFPALLATLDDVRSRFPDVQIFISATERNLDTIAAFMGLAASSGFSVDRLDAKLEPRHRQAGPFYEDRVPISIFSLGPSASSSPAK